MGGSGHSEDQAIIWGNLCVPRVPDADPNLQDVRRIRIFNHRISYKGWRIPHSRNAITADQRLKRKSAAQFVLRYASPPLSQLRLRRVKLTSFASGQTALKPTIDPRRSSATTPMANWSFHNRKSPSNRRLSSKTLSSRQWVRPRLSQVSDQQARISASCQASTRPQPAISITLLCKRLV